MPVIQFSTNDLLGPFALTVFLLLILFFGGKRVIDVIRKLIDDKFTLLQGQLDECHENHEAVSQELKSLRGEYHEIKGKLSVFEAQANNSEAFVKAISKDFASQFKGVIAQAIQDQKKPGKILNPKAGE